MILNDGELIAFVERGGRSVLTWEAEPSVVISGLIDVARHRNRSMTVAKIDGESSLTSRHREAMLAAGFATGYKGLTYRP